MKTTRPADLALGIAVTTRAVHGVLVEHTADGPRFVRRFTRARNGAPAAYTSPAAALAFAGDDAPGDVLHVGDGKGAGGELFLASEFGHLTASSSGAVAGATAATAAGYSVGAESELVTDQIAEILAECRDALGADPTLAVVLPGGDVTCVEVRVTDIPKEKDERRRARLLATLAEAVPDVDAERTVFLPMTAGENGALRALALVPRLNDPTTESLRVLRNTQRALPTARLLDAEVSLLIGLARLAPPPTRPGPHDAYGDLRGGDGHGEAAPVDVAVSDPADAPAFDAAAYDAGTFEAAPAEPAAPELYAPPLVGSTLVLRAGAEDTLALFLSPEGEVQHFEHMRSLTAFDAPETVCSRILLQQDEHNAGELARILVLSEGNEADLIDSFSLFFPEAHVGSLREMLPGGLAEEAARAPEAAVVPAIAAALRLVSREGFGFPAVNLLPKVLLRRRVVVPYTWHVYALMTLLFVTALFFVARFLSLQGDINDQRARVQAVDPVAAEAGVQTLQARIDSLHTVEERYTRSLGVLDSLLIGSDRWTRSLALVSREAATARGLWVESWKVEGESVAIIGTATSRDRVVQFAEGTGGDLIALTFSEIRDFPVYSFTLTLPLPADLPEAARYLREQAALQPALAAPGETPAAPAAPQAAAPVAPAP